MKKKKLFMLIRLKLIKHYEEKKIEENIIELGDEEKTLGSAQDTVDENLKCDYFKSVFSRL